MQELAKDIMEKDFFKIKKNEEIPNIIEKLCNTDLDCLIVIDEDDKMLGLISQGDVLFKEADLKYPSSYAFLGGLIYTNPKETREYDKMLKKELALTASELMTNNVVVGKEEMTIHEIANLMVNNKVSKIPIVDSDNRVVGIILKKHILIYLNKRYSMKKA